MHASADALPRLHVVTDDAVLAASSFPAVATALVERFGRRLALHVRGPSASGRRLHAIAAQCGAVCRREGAWLIVNDRVDVAMAVGAAGVQLGARSIAPGDARALLGPAPVIGCSVHDDDAAAVAVNEGADYVLMGTIYPSASHPDREPAGAQAVRACAARTGGRVIAIGGVSPARVAEVADAGAYGVAVLGGVWHSADPIDAAAMYLDAVSTAW